MPAGRCRDTDGVPVTSESPEALRGDGLMGPVAGGGLWVTGQPRGSCSRWRTVGGRAPGYDCPSGLSLCRVHTLALRSEDHHLLGSLRLML